MTATHEQSRNRWLVLAIVSSALLLIVIDMTVLYTALPRLTHELQASASQKLWIINAYPLVVAGLLPGLGALGDRIGHKQLFLSGLLVFGLASVIAAFAPGAEVLIASRVLLAMGAAMMMPATLSIIRLTFEDDKERAFAIGIWAAVASGGAAFGPVVGGILLEFFWWGSVFLINVPVVVLAFVVGARILKKHAGNKAQKWDLIGSAQIMVALIALTYAIKELGKPQADWMTCVITLLLGTGALVIFVRRQKRSAAPLIDFALFRNKQFLLGVVAASVMSATLIGFELVFSQRLQLVSGYSPLQAGLLILPIPLAAFFAGPLTGSLQPRLGTARLLWLSLLVAGVGSLTYLFIFDGDVLWWSVALAVFGFGAGAAITGSSTAIINNAPASRAGMAASIEEVAYELGGAMGVTILGSIMSVIYTMKLVLPADTTLPGIVHDSLDQARLVAEQLPPAQAERLLSLAFASFDDAFIGVIIGVTAMLFVTAGVVYGVSLRSAASAGHGLNPGH
ncbi:MFS transporter [Advenella mimigardefordensis]|uniref:Putative methyl viologen resistance protein SmvA n=1 Tax=Advenella mimigardefordensis (strain DSM 17166 / LMG 22922 / DPN7) TaxID=1247726 RepID=W0PDG2_ADVMD|nr:MFS transporter [Advenella mimigardefordensis]AHG63455.1 putative methyl viologen resistance protein SmvA [Advenella mimigardefordensis DPN7]